MNRIWKELLLGMVLGLLLPSVALNFLVQYDRSQTVTEFTFPEESTVGQDKVALTVYLRQADGTVQPMDMDTYLVGVLLAELPGDFDGEAKKAQAVVARTYALKASVTGGKHGDGSVCAESACCQGYRNPEEYLSEGGREAVVEGAQAAVAATSGYVLTYDGSLIEATYFSCSGGSTEDALAVWGSDYPYLRATQSPGEEGAAHYSDTVTFTPTEFASALGQPLSGDPENWFGLTTYTAGGGVATMVIGGKTYAGTQLRSLLGLRSTAFTLEAEEDCITVTTKGYGHRVGMSQYGAQAMAINGSDYAQILAHYYRGSELTLWQP